MLFSLLLSLSISKIPEGYSPLETNDEFIQKFALPFLNKYLDLLFPEVNLKKDSVAITEAGEQIIAGTNLFLVMNPTKTLKFSIILYVSTKNKVQLKNIQTLLPNNNILDAFTWLDPAHFTLEQQNELINLIKKYRNINLKVRNVISYRVKNYAGTRQHVIFEDTNGIIHSVVTSYCPSTQSSIIEYCESISHISVDEKN